MSRGVKIEFLDGGDLRIDPSSEVDGFDAVVQSCTVNLLVSKGSDPLFPDRGTDLLTRALSGAVFSSQSARHAANFASVDTLFFSRRKERADADDKPESVLLENLDFKAGKLSFEPRIISIDGRTGRSRATAASS